jgi:hypothetical protein
LNFADFTPAVFGFIREHENEDPFHLSLTRKEAFGIPAPILAEQIRALKKIRLKSPVWYRSDLVYPSALSVEQASSQPAAMLKGKMMSGETLVDLTGGLGLDAWAFSQTFNSVCFNDADERIVNCASFNFEKLSVNNITFSHADAVEFLRRRILKPDVVYIDPSRRGPGGRRKWKIDETSPDILSLLPELRKIDCRIMIKISPMVDIKFILDLIPAIHDIQVVSVANECKELLLMAGRGEEGGETTIGATDIAGDQQIFFESNYRDEQKAGISYSAPLKFIYDPNAAIHKTGLYKVLGSRRNLPMLHPNTHLYTSDLPDSGFPGRMFQVEKMYAFYEFFRKKPVAKAHIMTRNFPMKSSQIREKTGLRESPYPYLIATTIQENKPVFLLANLIKTE